MTNEDIIRMALEAELYSYLWGGDINQQSLKALERFAAIVAANEREACAKVCEEFGHTINIETWDMAGEDCAAAIRERSEK